MRLSEHFTLEEMCASELAARRGWKNVPDELTLEHLTTTAGFMEGVRKLLGYPILVTSGFRSVQLNAALGGAVASAHQYGYAVDFLCPGFGTPFEVCEKLSKELKDFDQLIYEYETWTHVSFDPRMRKQLLTISHGQGYQLGLLA